MLSFKEITLKDKPIIDSILKDNFYKSCEYSFGNHFIWKESYDIKFAIVNGFYVATLYDEGGTSFLFPAGNMKNDALKPVIEQLLEYCEQNNMPFHMHSMLEFQREELIRLFPDKFAIEQTRDNFDYIYLKSDLSLLAGKKYHGKRNHLARFYENNWKYEALTNDNLPDCRQMYEQWCIDNDIIHDEGKLEEKIAVNRCLDYFNELGFFGGVLYLDEKAVAFAIAERTNEEMVVVHIEKAFSNINGAYPAINQQLAKECHEKVIYINREDDVGIEGLRKAKLSYYPEILLEKYCVTLKKVQNL